MTDSNSQRTVQDIQRKIDRGEVVVLTAQEICDRVRRGDIPELEEVDVVTTATSALMSGTYAVLSFKVAEPETFNRAEKVWINDVPAQVGPCPNERIGLLDLLIPGTAQSRRDSRYGAGNLFQDLVRGKEVRVDILTDAGQHLGAETTLKEIPHAVLHASRNAFKNYLAFVNPGKLSVPTIFHWDRLGGDYAEMTFCGCGELNPLENDPELRTIGVGTRVLINGSQGLVTGPGTRSCADKPNLTGYADMHDMVPEYMGGFTTGHGPDIITTWAVPIPILNREVLEATLKTDGQIPLKVVDIRNRECISQITYGDVWQHTDHEITFNRSLCQTCDACQVQAVCPVQAVRSDDRGRPEFDRSRCFNCGLCVSQCKGGAFRAVLGSVTLDNLNQTVPVTLRQSNRIMALKAAQDLKQQIQDGRFRMTTPLGKIHFPDNV